MASLLGFDHAIALAGLIIVFYTRGFLSTVIDNGTRNRTLVDQIAIFTAMNTILMVILGIGWWKNKWLRTTIKLKSFDDAFSRVAFYTGIASTLLFVLQYYEHPMMASALFAIIMYPIIAASNFGYAHEIRRFAAK